MKRRLFNVLAEVSLLLCVATIALSRFSPSRPSYLTRFDLFRHDISIMSGSKYGVIVRAYAAGTAMVPLNAQRDLKTTGEDVAYGRAFHFGITWGDGYTISNITSKSPSIVPGRKWKEVQFIFRVPIILLAISSCLFAYISIKMRRGSPPGLCVKCGYDLRATPDRCPECGAMSVTVVQSRP